MRFCAAIHLTSSDTIRDSRGSIENKETPRGDGNTSSLYLCGNDNIENKETPRGDGNPFTFEFITKTGFIENKETPRGDGNNLKMFRNNCYLL